VLFSCCVLICIPMNYFWSSIIFVFQFVFMKRSVSDTDNFYLLSFSNYFGLLSKSCMTAEIFHEDMRLHNCLFFLFIVNIYMLTKYVCYFWYTGLKICIETLNIGFPKLNAYYFVPFFGHQKQEKWEMSIENQICVWHFMYKSWCVCTVWLCVCV